MTTKAVGGTARPPPTATASSGNVGGPSERSSASRGTDGGATGGGAADDGAGSGAGGAPGPTAPLVVLEPSDASALASISHSGCASSQLFRRRPLLVRYHAEPVTGAAGAAHRLSPSPRAKARRLSLVSVTSSETMSPRSPRATSPRPRMLPQQHRRSSIVPVDELDGAGSETPAGRWQSPRRHKVSPSFSEV